ncbi:receptor-type tyrosine-protein kinase FLT3 [Bombina bombina]|uniref:receptor-type tyrosine-protein kinase FLT3 n=1 Tax=Bombina bombina TaxID=8345 RepID=UPI00235A9D03|nr:receptor-type tyrosine-protein kinase FLT3 [Bombina bombina]
MKELKNLCSKWQTLLWLQVITTVGTLCSVTNQTLPSISCYLIKTRIEITDVQQAETKMPYSLQRVIDLGCSQSSKYTYTAAVTVEVNVLESMNLKVVQNISDLRSCVWSLRQSNMNCSIIQNSDNSSVYLQVLRTTKRHAGIYELSVKNEEASYHVHFPVKVKSKPRKPYFNESRGIVSCISESYPKPSVDWLICLSPYSSDCRCENITGEMLYKKVDPYGLEQVEHKIKANRLLDEHIWCCATNDLGRECSQLYTIDLNSETSVPDLLIKTGEPFIMRCRARYKSYDFDINFNLGREDKIMIFEESAYDSPSSSPSSSSMTRVVFASTARMEKSNNFTCVSSSHSSKAAVVKLLDNGFIDLNTSREVHDIERNEDFCLLVVFKAYPTVQCIWYYYSVSLPCDLHARKDGYSQSKHCSHRFEPGEYMFYVENDDVHLSKNFSLNILQATYLPHDQNNFMFYIGTGICVLCIFSLILLLLNKFKKQYRYKSQLQMIQYIGPSDNEYIYIDFNIVEYDLKWEFPRENLEFGKVLGSGAFGKVVNATAYGISKPGISLQVAVKMLKEHANSSEKDALMSELKMMTQIGHHENIVNLLGACTLSGPIYLIFEYCCHGDLLNYLRSKRETFHQTWTDVVKDNNFSFYHNLNQDQQFRQSINNESYNEIFRTQHTNKTQQNLALSLEHEALQQDEEIKYENTQKYVEEDLNVLTFEDLLCFSYQVAKGMEFLESKLCIHRDLAARNILLTYGKVAKICDFGLARDVENDSNYVVKGNACLPVKWMAPESIFDGIYTIKSDVWSYGILLWEIFSLGVNPYPGMPVDAKFYKLLQSGYKMDQPYYASDEVYFLMQSCWAFDSRNRPCFPQLVSFLGYQLSNAEALVYHHRGNKQSSNASYQQNFLKEVSENPSIDANGSQEENVPMCQ